MNWKGYVQIIPTDDQVKRLEQAIKRADDFVKNTDEQAKIISNSVYTEKRRYWIFWQKSVEMIDQYKVNKDSPLGVSWFVWTDDDYFYLNDIYEIMKDIQQMIQAGSPLYLDNKMAKVWNKILTEGI